MKYLHGQKNVNISDPSNCPNVQKIKAEGYKCIKIVCVSVTETAVTHFQFA